MARYSSSSMCLARNTVPLLPQPSTRHNWYFPNSMVSAILYTSFFYLSLCTHCNTAMRNMTRNSGYKVRQSFRPAEYTDSTERIFCFYLLSLQAAECMLSRSSSSASRTPWPESYPQWDILSVLPCEILSQAAKHRSMP